MFSRLELLIGDKLKKLKESNVIIFGIGGVGGYVVEMLVRSGVGRLTIVDFDVIDKSNKNRQIIALDSTLNLNKVDVMKKRAEDINKDCLVSAINKKLTKENIEDFGLSNFDYIIDAIDTVSSKIALIEYSHKNNIPIISAMGAGNRTGIPEIVIDDIYNTYNDGLAKVLRHNLRKKGIKNHDVVYAKNKSKSSNNIIGSIAYFPAMVGCMLSAFVIEKIINKGENYGN